MGALAWLVSVPLGADALTARSSCRHWKRGIKGYARYPEVMFGSGKAGSVCKSALLAARGAHVAEKLKAVEQQCAAKG